MGAMRIIDLSQAVDEDTPVYPGDGPVRVTILERTSMNLSRIDLSLHAGTHMDAPFHFIAGGATTDRVPLERCMEPARLIDLRGAPPGSTIGRGQIEKHRGSLREVRAAILHTGWSAEWGGPRYFDDHPCLSEEAAQLLVECGVRLVGVDMPSVDRAPYPAHRVLLGAGVLIVENLTNLDAVGAGVFQFVALPLKLAGRDGSPVRAVAIA
jgi:arylformamidase